MNRIRLKLQAKEIIAAGKPSPIAFSLIYVLISLIIALLSTKLVGSNINGDTLMSLLENSDIEGFYDYLVAHAPSPGASALDFVLRILSIVLGAGFAIFALNIVKGASASLWNVLDGFGIFLRVIWLSFLEGIFIALWSLLLIFPAFIAAYSYRQALFLLIEHPEMSAFECLKESKRLMRGHKGELFWLDLSFIGWILLSALPGIGYLVSIWFAPYYKITNALYYRQLIYTPCEYENQNPYMDMDM